MSIQREEGLSISMIFRRAYQRGKFYQTLTDERQNARHHTPSDYFPAVYNIESVCILWKPYNIKNES